MDISILLVSFILVHTCLHSVSLSLGRHLDLGSDWICEMLVWFDCVLIRVFLHSIHIVVWGAGIVFLEIFLAMHIHFVLKCWIVISLWLRRVLLLYIFVQALVIALCLDVALRPMHVGLLPFVLHHVRCISSHRTILVNKMPRLGLIDILHVTSRCLDLVRVDDSVLVQLLLVKLPLHDKELILKLSYLCLTLVDLTI